MIHEVLFSSLASTRFRHRFRTDAGVVPFRSPTSSLAAVGRRVSQITSGVFETRDIIEEHEVRRESHGSCSSACGTGGLCTREWLDLAETPVCRG